MARIQLTKGYYALVDDELFDRLNSFSWYASGKFPNIYAARRMKDCEIYPRTLLYMHHHVLGVHPKDLAGLVVDHKNGNKLDNRTANLTITTYARNGQNSVRALSQLGVGRDNTHDTYKAYVNIAEETGTKRVNIGTYKTFEEAYEARRLFLKEI